MTLTAKLFLSSESLYDDDLFDDILGLFPDSNGYAPKAGACGKYIYDGNNWLPVIEHDDSYYPPEADQSLVNAALLDVDTWGIPEGTPYVDLGAGGRGSFMRYALPIIRQLRSSEYIGVDFCDGVLDDIRKLAPIFGKEVLIKAEKLDLFFPTAKVLSIASPALGVMNGLTLGNIGNAHTLEEVEQSLVSSLKYLSQLCGHGWLLATIDTNQCESVLKKAYDTPSLQSLFLSVLHRAAHELPVASFDPNGFVYEPVFRPELQQLAHMATATSSQNFTLGSHPIHVEKGQRIHLLSSYKFKQAFFEKCVRRAGLSVTKHWEHKTGVILYLLRDNLCPIPLLNVSPIPAPALRRLNVA